MLSVDDNDVAIVGRAPAVGAPPEVVLASIAPSERVLSVPGGEHPITPDLQCMLVLTEMALYIAPQQRTHRLVLGFKERLKKLGALREIKLATLDAIDAAYRNHKNAHNQSGMRGETAEQDAVIDLLREGLALEASDIHMLAGRTGTEVRMRVMGRMETRHRYTSEYGLTLMSSLYSSMCDVAAQSFNKNASQRARVKAAYTQALGLYGARVQTRPTHDGLYMVLRLLKSDDRIMTLAELGFLQAQVELMEELATMPYGVTLISGPTGSGKSRTLQTQMTRIHEIDKGASTIITIEDPPEYPIEGAIVTPLVVPDRNDPLAVSKAWQDSMSESMRLDPDFIMVGEISDVGSAKTAFSGAKTGHGVWSTLHANDATGIPKRLIDMTVSADDVLDPTLLVGLSAQRLLPGLCARCKVPLIGNEHRLARGVLERLKRVSSSEQLAGVSLRGDGCSACREGEKGRRLVAEVVKTSPEFFEAYSRGGSLNARKYWVANMNGITMLRHALHHVWTGEVDPATAEDVQKLDTDFTILGVDYVGQSALA